MEEALDDMEPEEVHWTWIEARHHVFSHCIDPSGRCCFDSDEISQISMASWTLLVGRTLLITSQHALTLQAGRTHAGARGGQVVH